MARYVSDSNIAGFQYESGTYATATGTTLQWIGLVESIDIQEDLNTKYFRYNGNLTRNQSVSVDGVKQVGGNVTFYPQSWQMLGFALGSVVDGGSPSPYTHVISELNSSASYAFTSGVLNPFASFSLTEAQQSVGTGKNFITTANGCIVDSLEISAGMGDLTTCKLDFVGQSVTKTSGTVATVTDPGTKPFVWSNWQFTLAGTAFDEVKKFTFGVKNSVERRPYLNGSNVTAVPVPLNRDYSLQLTADNTSERIGSSYDIYFKGGSEFNMTMVCTDFVAGTGSRDMTITLSGCRLNPLDTATKNDSTTVNEAVYNIVPRTASVLVNDTIFKYNPY